jgi:serine/threonine protein kinase
MRAVLRTLAQCHAHKILHRDIKPGNFMLLSDADNAPVKAIGRQAFRHKPARLHHATPLALVYP